MIASPDKGVDASHTSGFNTPGEMPGIPPANDPRGHALVRWGWTILATLHAPAWALQPAPTLGVSGTTSPERLIAVRAGEGREPFLVADPDSAVSPARRDNTDLIDKRGRTPAPRPGYTVFARVVVPAADAVELTERVRQAGVRAKVHPHPSVRGFWLVECDTVSEAARLADALAADPRYTDAAVDIERPHVLRDLPTDPDFAQQWFLRNTVTPAADLNVEDAWSAGVTGLGVTVGIVEGGWQVTHPDIAANYDEGASMTGGSSTSHSTSCAGLVGARANNGAGGVGVAFNAHVSKLIYGNDVATANAFAYRNDLNDVKSNSWGLGDDGTLQAMSPVERAAIEQGVTSGRDGLGTVFCWAAGNGGDEDRMDYDPYASSRHTIAIGAIGDHDTHAPYSERGSSLLVVTHSSGNERFVFTTANQSGYNASFGGTSAACPIGAGVVALLLEANPDLTVRDVQHVLVNSARRCDPASASWTTNGAGRAISYDYGFGALDAGAAVTLARNWTPVAPVQPFDSGVVAVNAAIPDNNAAGLTRTIWVPPGLRIEHVELVMNATTTYAGDLYITLTSPSATPSVLAENRDDPQDNLNDYLFTTVRCWGEEAGGIWTVRVSDRGPLDLATWNSFRLRIYGTPSGPTPCGVADLAEPIGQLNFFDVSAYLALYAAGDPDADLHADGQINFFDVGAFLLSYNAGCP